MLTLLGFGSSARRNATGWTDSVPVRATLNVCQPDRTIDGASPSGGADDVFHDAAVEHFLRRRLDPLLAERCPHDPSLDGPAPGGMFARNTRQYVTHRPTLAIGGITGKVGSEMSSGSAHMLSVCLAGAWRGRGKQRRCIVPPCPVVVYREDGVEPYRHLATALAQFRRLYVVTQDARLVAPGKALASLCECGDPDPAEVLAALRFAADGSRWAPWIEAVAETVRRC